MLSTLAVLVCGLTIDSIVEPEFNVVDECTRLSFGKPEECLCYRKANRYCSFDPDTSRCDTNYDWVQYRPTRNSTERRICSGIWAKINALVKIDPTGKEPPTSLLYSKARASILDWTSYGMTNRTSNNDQNLPDLDDRVLKSTVAPHLISTNASFQRAVVAQGSARTMANMIPLAKYEILLQTYIWRPKSNASRAIGFALRQLQEKSSEHNRTVTVLIIASHYRKPLKSWHTDVKDITKFGLPNATELPNLRIKFRTVHVAFRGSLHSKSLIIDRQVALITSGNVNDKPFLELMAVVQGHVVESLRADFMYSWARLIISPVASGWDLIRQLEMLDHDGLNMRPDFEEDSVPVALENMDLARAENPSEYNVSLSLLELPDLPPSDLDIPLSVDAVVPTMINSKTPVGAIKLWTRNKDNPAFRSLLGLIHNAQSEIFIAVPNFNTDAVLEALVDALGRGVRISLTTTLGMNDATERFSGGTNLLAYRKFQEAAMERLSMNEEELQSRLKLCWYVKKNETAPTMRWVSHIKFIALDDAVSYFGSTNLDDQSIWYSQEVNLVVDDMNITKTLKGAIIETQEYQRACFPDVQDLID